MAMKGYSKLEVVEGGGRVIAWEDNVPTASAKVRAAQLQAAHGSHVKVLVDGVDWSPAAPAAPRTSPPGPPVAVPTLVPPQAPHAFDPRSGEYSGVELAHYLLWDSYQRASQTQAFMLEQMTSLAVEMNRRFTDQVDNMQQRYQTAMSRIDQMAFEQKMIEHETMARRLSDHHRRLVEDERRANQPGIVDQLTRSVLTILDAIGSDSIDRN